MAAATIRRLVVVRHAKSAWPEGVPDAQRPLGPRGRDDAPRMGRWIAGRFGAPDVVVRSPAVRVAQTWELLATQLPQPGEVLVDGRIYHAWGGELVAVVRALPAAAGTAILVGHEPGVSQLTLSLADRANHELRYRLSGKFPTCAVAVLESQLPWEQFGPGCAQLVEFVTPKDF